MRRQREQADAMQATYWHVGERVIVPGHGNMTGYIKAVEVNVQTLNILAVEEIEYATEWVLVECDDGHLLGVGRCALTSAP